MKTICIAASHEYRKKTSNEDFQLTKEKSECKQNIPLILENGDTKDHHTAVALCYITNSQRICLIDGDDENEFYDLLYRESDGKCVPHSEPKDKNKSKEKYLQDGKNIQQGALAMPSPPSKRMSGSSICNNEDYMKNICVGLMSDYQKSLSAKQVQEIKEKSKCEGSTQLVSKTHYTLDYYRAALCHLDGYGFKCIIDGYNESQFILVPSYILESELSCVWKPEELQIKLHLDYLQKATALLNPPG